RRRRGDDMGLEAIAAQVRSGDVTNREAMAAQRYWPALFNDPDFRRRRDAPDQNRMLNYGYAALRAAVGRALCAAGLHPSLGVHHRDRTNPWCLADDLMEPYRPLIDEETAEIVASIGGDIALDGEVKAQIVGALHGRIEHEGESRTVMDWIGRSASSMAQAFLGERRQLLLPEGLWR
ncbi:MAG: type II CRISPR-associated endonuclease Cas1, partial [Deltaproteobacteria bacterium]